MKPSSYFHFLLFNVPLAASRPAVIPRRPSESCEAEIGGACAPSAPPLQPRDESPAAESPTGRLASLNTVVAGDGSPEDKKESKEWGLDCHDKDGPNIFFTHPLLPNNITFNVHTEWTLNYPSRLARKLSKEGYNVTKLSERTCFWKEMRKVKKHWIQRGKISIRATGDANITMAGEQLKDIGKIMEDLVPTVELTLLALGLTIPIWGMLLLRACVATVAFCCGLFMVIKESIHSSGDARRATYDHSSDEGSFDDGGANSDSELQPEDVSDVNKKDSTTHFTTNRRWSSFSRAGSGSWSRSGSGSWRFPPAYTEEGRTVELNEMRHGSNASSSSEAPPYPADMPPRYSIIDRS